MCRTWSSDLCTFREFLLLIGQGSHNSGKGSIKAATRNNAVSWFALFFCHCTGNEYWRTGWACSRSLILVLNEHLRRFQSNFLTILFSPQTTSACLISWLPARDSSGEWLSGAFHLQKLFFFPLPLWLPGRKLSAGSVPEGVCVHVRLSVCVFCSEGCFVETASWIVDSFPHSAPMRPTHRKLVLLNTADPPSSPPPLLRRQVCTLWAEQRDDSESSLPLLPTSPPLG